MLLMRIPNPIYCRARFFRLCGRPRNYAPSAKGGEARPTLMTQYFMHNKNLKLRVQTDLECTGIAREALIVVAVGFDVIFSEDILNGKFHDNIV